MHLWKFKCQRLVSNNTCYFCLSWLKPQIFVSNGLFSPSEPQKYQKFDNCFLKICFTSICLKSEIIPCTYWHISLYDSWLPRLRRKCWESGKQKCILRTKIYSNSCTWLVCFAWQFQKLKTHRQIHR